MARIGYLDTAKAFGIFLVYYGHFVQKLQLAGSHAAFAELRLIYAFHVPLFFFLAGMFWKPSPLPVWRTCLVQARSRLMPVVFFAALAVPFFVFLNHEPASAVLTRAQAYALGLPRLNWVTWFLVCLFSLEVINAVLTRLVPVTQTAMAAAYAGFFFLAGHGLEGRVDSLARVIGVPANAWFVAEAFTAGGFYWLGNALRPWLTRPARGWADAGWMVACGGLLLATYGLNDGPYRSGQTLVLMNELSHGDYSLFVLSAVAGIGFSVCLARAWPFRSRLIDFIGRNTLVYLGLNGLCLYFFDVKVIYKLAYVPQGLLAINLYALAYVVGVMLLFVPLTVLIRRWVPRLWVP